MHTTDTLLYDTAKIARYQADSHFDYNSQLVHKNFNLYEIVINWFRELMQRFFGSVIADKYSGTILAVFFVLFILLLIFVVYKKRPELFYREKKFMKYNVEEETIYGVDFNSEINNALSRKDYQLAVRLVYLQTLKHLSDFRCIDWQTYKTPTEYLYEMKRKGVSDEFRQLTNRFLMVRYGNFEATESTYETVKNLQQIIWKGGNW
ncbi:protein of unknown function [Bacteroides luti]|uniref:Protein-glutamine gamma-glutamyltransferase-like C-terminal domain-containing protein n=1 Tax=Bacteroides luti TaxID=1297750 RepID=A0A1M5HCG7_9BACE|nr:DUF4129 domain-containing protein [Bacteroides luti]SHG13656.1 protein of unknown function [Bacteroides luti]